MGVTSIWHWLIVLLIVVLFFGTQRLTSGARDLGNAIREFKKGLRGDEPPAQLSNDTPPAEPISTPASTTNREPVPSTRHSS